MAGFADYMVYRHGQGYSMCIGCHQPCSMCASIHVVADVVADCGWLRGFGMASKSLPVQLRMRVTSRRLVSVEDCNHMTIA